MWSIIYRKLTLISKEIWSWCEERDIWLFASYIPSAENLADLHSRIKPAETEYELSTSAFIYITKIFGQPEVDLLASNKNHKCQNYFSRFPDPHALAIDAFIVSWSNIFFFAFPPFCLILRALNKIILDKGVGIFLVTKWPTQPWYPIWRKLKFLFFFLALTRTRAPSLPWR